jgi:ABC-type Fe3+-hydroxamate transport system substrate-binding protein
MRHWILLHRRDIQSIQFASAQCKDLKVRRILYRVLLLGMVASHNLVYASNSASAAKRIVSLAPSLTELVFAAGASKHLVAVSAFSDFPEEAKRLPQVADYAGINIEALVALKPDLVLVWDSGTRAADVARLREFRIRAEVIRVASLADVSTAIRRIGVLAGTSATAEAAATAFATRIARLDSAQQRKRRVTVFFEISPAPLTTINHEHVISQVISACGGQNVFASASALVFQPSREQLLQQNPDVILRSASTVSPRKPDESVYEGLAAKQRGQIYTVNADHILRPGPRLADAAEQVCHLLDQARHAKNYFSAAH